MVLLYVIFLALCCASVELVVVRVEQGLLEGEVITRVTGNGKYYSFKGIPYAAPPVGQLRFKAPQPPLPWEGVRCAKRHGSICSQIVINTGEYMPGSSEDCLFLNVYTPTLEPETPLTVMFYIHGGLFTIGSGNDDQYGPDFLLDQNVILVTINFRLSTLGFLSLDISEAPGNAGLKDQVAALQWVKRNIAKFGGDPDQVTIFGESTGGSSVSLHALSPMSKGLFKRGIALSGVFLKEFNLPFEHKRRALLLSQQLGLYTQDPVEAFQFLQNVPVKRLIESEPFVQYSEKPRRDLLEHFYFSPIIEKDFGDEHFLVEDPVKLLRENKTNDVVLILGHAAKEGIYRVITQKKYVLKYYPQYKEFLVPSQIANTLDEKTVLELADRIQKHYFGNKEISEKTMKEIFNFYTYFSYVYNIHRYLEIWSKNGNKVYFYEFSCFSERNINGLKGIKYGVKNATHTDIRNYIFDNKKLVLEKYRPSYKMIMQTCTLFTNFAKYGEPTTNTSFGNIWMEYTENDKSYLKIDLELTLKSLNLDEIDFWRNIYTSVGMFFS